VSYALSYRDFLFTAFLVSTSSIISSKSVVTLVLNSFLSSVVIHAQASHSHSNEAHCNSAAFNIVSAQGVAQAFSTAIFWLQAKSHRSLRHKSSSIFHKSFMACTSIHNHSIDL
jgi:hypothetical protein